MRIVMMGPQGSGKGIQSELLSRKFRLKHLSVGDILRDEATKNTRIGKVLAGHMNKGELIPDHLNDHIISRVIRKAKDGFILDGYPRNMHQLEYLLGLTKINLVISIHISDKESIKRITRRRVCTATHKVYIADEITDKDVKECERAGGMIVRRDDDTPKAVKERIKLYHKETAPLLGCFKRKKIKVLVINGERAIDTVSKDIISKIRKLT